MTKEPEDWPSKLRALAEERHTTIKGLAIQLGVTQQYLDQVIHGKSKPSSYLKFRYYGLSSWTPSMEQVIKLLPDDLAAAVRQKNEEALKKLGDEAIQKAAATSKKTTPKSR